MSMSSNIGRKVKKARKQKGISQASLAEKIERSVDTISHIERGLSLPTIETVILLSRELDIPLHHLLDLPNPNEKDNRRLNQIEEIQAIVYNLSDSELNTVLKLLKAL